MVTGVHQRAPLVACDKNVGPRNSVRPGQQPETFGAYLPDDSTEAGELEGTPEGRDGTKVREAVARVQVRAVRGSHAPG
jgi:hypothetical protein